MTYWPDLAVPVIEVARCRCEGDTPGFRFARRAVPPQLIERRRGARHSIPALTALDQIAAYGGDGIDRALRARMATLDGMRLALSLTPHRRGNVDRRTMLLDSRDEPWSALERRAHRLLRQGCITGWRTNVAVTAGGATYFLDVLFDDVPLAIELDGREFHGTDRFEADRERDDRLASARLHVLHFTWSMVVERPEWVLATVRGTLRRLCAVTA